MKRRTASTTRALRRSWLRRCAGAAAPCRRPSGRRDAAARAAGVAAAVPDVPADWWNSFNDARLDALVDEALANNRDLARAMARIDESRAALRSANADQLPEGRRQCVGAAGSASARTHALTLGGNQPIGNDFRADAERRLRGRPVVARWPT